MTQENSEITLSISALNSRVTQVIRAGFPEGFWVVGEIQGYDRNRTKRHVFFDLCEKELETDSIKARIGAVIFQNRKEALERVIKNSGEDIHLEDGLEVRFFCRLDFYGPHGAMRLIVEGIDPVHTLGRLAQEKKRLIALLKKNGTLDKNKHLDLPEVCLHIGLISSYDSAAYNDFLSELSLSGIGFRVVFCNALMQGKGAEEDICVAFEKLQSLPHLDAIVLSRGGGSISDLSCFDSKRIAETIAACRFPVLTGIGHEIDLSIADLAAHTYQKTPTAIARFLVEKIENVLEEFDRAFELLQDCALQKLDEGMESLRLSVSRLESASVHFFRQQEKQLIGHTAFFRTTPARILSASRQDLAHKKDSLLRSLGRYFEGHRTVLEKYRRLAGMADPSKLFRRGFSITRKQDGSVIKNINDLSLEEEIVTEVYNGTATSKVAMIKKKEKKHESG